MYGVGKARIRIGPVVLLHLHVEVFGKAVVVTCTNCDRGSGQSHGDLGVTWKVVVQTVTEPISVLSLFF